MRRLGDRDPPAEESCDLDMESGICSTSSISEENKKAIKQSYIGKKCKNCRSQKKRVTSSDHFQKSICIKTNIAFTVLIAIFTCSILLKKIKVHLFKTTQNPQPWATVFMTENNKLFVSVRLRIENVFKTYFRL